MTGNRYLLDTNIVSAWLKGESNVVSNIQRAMEIHIPVTVVGELCYGAQFSNRVEGNMNDLKNIIDAYSVLLINGSTAMIYGSIKSELRKKGRPIPENDIWIAAITIQHNLVLITRDKHFDEIEGLRMKKW